jgi:hypothetical protein
MRIKQCLIDKHEIPRKTQVRHGFQFFSLFLSQLETRSLLVAAGNFSSYFSASLHFWIRYLCKAEMDIDNPGNTSQRFA